MNFEERLHLRRRYKQEAAGTLLAHWSGQQQMSAMVERVARAIGTVLWSERFDGTDDLQRAEFAKAARAAIEAMYEPSDSMYAASTRYIRENGAPEHSGDFLYQTMIEAALKD